MVCEFNYDLWPNAGLLPVPGRKGQFAYGLIPPGLYEQVKAAFLALPNKQQVSRKGGT